MFYEVDFLDLSDLKTTSEPVRGSFVTPPAGKRDLRFVWSGDTAGQGWGINPDLGGMRIYETMRQVEPDFFIHSRRHDLRRRADAEARGRAAGRHASVAEPHHRRRARSPRPCASSATNYRYNLMDENLRRFNAAVPMYAQWDDHEVTNNWYGQQVLRQRQRYKEK